MNENLRNILNGGYDAFSEDSEDFIVKAYNGYKIRPDKYSDVSGLILSEAFNRIRKKKHEYVPANAPIETTPHTDQELYNKFFKSTEGLDVSNLNIPVGGLSDGKESISADDAEQMGLAHLDERQLAHYLNNKDAIDSQAKNGAFNLIPDNEFDADASEEDKALSRETYRVLAPIVEGYNPLDWQDPKRKKELEKEIFASLNAKLSDRVKNNAAFFVDGFVNSLSLGYAPSLIPQELRERIPMTTGQTVSNVAGNLFGMFLPAGGISKGVGLGLKAMGGASKSVLAHLTKQFPHFNKVGKLALQNPKSVYVASSTANLMMREGLTLGLYGQAVKHPEGTTIEDRVKEFGSHFLEGTLYGGIGLTSKIAAANKTLRPYEFQAHLAEIPLVGYMSYKMELSRRPDDVAGAVTAAFTNSFLHSLPAYTNGYIKHSELIDNAVKIGEIKWGNEVKQGAIKGFEALFDEMTPAQKQHALWQYKKIRNERFKDTEFDENQGKIKDLTLQERDAIVQKKIKEEGIEQFPEDIQAQKEFDEKLEAKQLEEAKKIDELAQEKARKEGVEKEKAQEKLRSDIASGKINAATGKPFEKPIWTMKNNSKEYAEMDIDRMYMEAFGFSEKSLTDISPTNLNVRWKADIENAEHAMKESGLSDKEWAESVSLEEGIDVSYKDGQFYIEDGHHRYLAAKIRGERLNVNSVDIKDKPHITAIKKALMRGDDVPDEVIKQYPELWEEHYRYGSEGEMNHRPWADGEPANNLFSKGEDSPTPSDLLTSPHYYNYASDRNSPIWKENMEAMEHLKNIQGNPDAKITIYRASPEDADLNSGDWVTLSKSYAERHKEGAEYSVKVRNKGLSEKNKSKEKFKVHEYRVRADEVIWDGNDIAEWGYFPKEKIDYKKVATDRLLKMGMSKVTKAFPTGLSVKETSKYVKKDGTQVTADEFQNLRKEKDFVEEDWLPVEDYIEQRGELKSIISELWNRHKLKGKATYEDFKALVKEMGAENNIVTTREIYDDIEKELRVTKARDLIEEYEDRGVKDPSDPIVNTKTEANDAKEYVGNILKKKFDSNEDEGIAIQAALNNLFSGTEFKAAQGQRGWNEILAKGQGQDFVATVIQKIAKGHYKPNNLNMSEQLIALRHVLSNALDMMIKNDDPSLEKAYESWFRKVAEANISFTSEAGRLLNTAKIRTGKVDEDLLAKTMKNLKLNREMRKLLGDLLDDPKLLKRSDTAWKWVEIARNFKLSSPASLVKSIVGNTVSHALHVGDMATAPFYNRVLTKIANKWMGENFTQSVRAEEALLYFGGAKKGFKPALKTAWDVLFERDAAIQENSYLQNEGFSERYISGVKGKLLRLPQNAQASLDVLHRLPAIYGQLNRYASRGAQEFFHKQGIVPTARQRLDKINELVENPTEDILRKAYADAEFITFQERPSDILSKHLSHLRKQSAGVQWLIPFFNTPVNIFKQNFYHRNPVGLLHKGFKVGRDIANKRITQEGLNDASTELARATTGSAMQLLTSYAIYKLFDGDITEDGRNMTDEQRRLAETDHGWMPNAIKLKDRNGASKYYSFEGYEPIAGWLSLARSYKDREGDGNWMKQFIQANEEMAYSFLDNPAIQQVSDITKVFDGRKDFMDFTIDLAVGSVFPNFLKQTSRVLNPEKLERAKKPKNYSHTDAFFDAELWKRKMAKSIPFSNHLPYLKDARFPKRDIFGEAMIFEDPVGSMFGFRGFSSDAKPEESKVYEEINRLFWAGERDILRTPNYQGDVSLKPETYDFLIQLAGKAFKDSLVKVINSPVWDDISREAEENGESGNKAQHDTILKIKNGIFEAQRKLVLKEEMQADSATAVLRWGIPSSNVPIGSARSKTQKGYQERVFNKNSYSEDEIQIMD